MKRVKRLLPGKIELSILAALVALSTLIASLFANPQAGMTLAAMPLFFVACLMGMRRNGQLSSPDGRRPVQ